MNGSANGAQWIEAPTARNMKAWAIGPGKSHKMDRALKARNKHARYFNGLE